MQLDTTHGDTAPLPRYQLIDKDKQPADLTGITSVVQHFDGAPAAGSACAVDGDPTDGIVRLSSREHLPAPVGDRIELDFKTEVTYSDGTKQTFPTGPANTWVVWAENT